MPRTLLSTFLLATAVVCFVLVGLILWEGGRWTGWWISVANPTSRLALGGGALFAWYALRAGKPAGAKAWAGFLGKPAMLLFSLGGCWMGAEIAVRAYLRHTQGFNTLDHFRAYEEGAAYRPRSATPMVAVVELCENRRLIYDLRPNLTMQFGGRLMITNAEGMRERLSYPETPQAPGTARVVGIGDSGMWGWGLEQDEDYLAVLETRLNQRAGGPPVEVLNLAVPGYNTWQAVEMLQAKGMRYRPDVVILGWCDNDWSLPSFLFDQREFNERDVSYLWLFLFRREEFANRVKPEVVERSAVDKERVDPVLLDSAGKEGVTQALTTLRDLSEAHGFHALMFGALKPDILAILDDVGVPYLNAYEAVPAGSVPKEWYIHGWHPRAPGHEKLAEVLEDSLRARGWLPN
jgi:lysophospholipase L1-like esterase